jgi:thiamine-monophosphate kinase
MGGRPLHTHLSLAIPKTWTEAEILEFMGGYRALAEQYGISLLGGDLSRSDRDFVISASVNGTAPSRSVIGRGGAEPGDVIWVSGTLGGAAAGLAFLREEAATDCPDELLEAFLVPQPEVELGLTCSKSGRVKALIDISDGLAGDLGHILKASGVGATLQEEALPVAKDLREIARRKNLNLNDLVLRGGEDYRLLGCTARPAFDGLCNLGRKWLGREIFPIGHIESQPGLRLQHADGKCEILAPKGHDHFT